MDELVARRRADMLVVFWSHLFFAIRYSLQCWTGLQAGERISMSNAVNRWRTAFIREFEIEVGRAVFSIRPMTNDIRQPFSEGVNLALLSGISVPVFVDVGAYIGYYAVTLALKSKGRGVVVAVEPEPANFSALTKNAKMNRCDNIILVHAAAASTGGTVTLWRPAERTETGQFTVGRSAYFPNTHGGIRVRARRLDEILSSLGIAHVDCLKIDTEGTEDSVLLGAGEYLGGCNTILFEAWDDDHLSRCREALAKAGRFSITKVDGENYMATRL